MLLPPQGFALSSLRSTSRTGLGPGPARPWPPWPPCTAPASYMCAIANAALARIIHACRPPTPILISHAGASLQGRCRLAHLDEFLKAHACHLDHDDDDDDDNVTSMSSSRPMARGAMLNANLDTPLTTMRPVTIRAPVPLPSDIVTYREVLHGCGGQKEAC